MFFSVLRRKAKLNVNSVILNLNEKQAPGASWHIEKISIRNTDEKKQIP